MTHLTMLGIHAKTTNPQKHCIFPVPNSLIPGYMGHFKFCPGVSPEVPQSWQRKVALQTSILPARLMPSQVW